MSDDYDPNERLAPPPEDSSPLRAIEITFAIPSYVTHEQWAKLREVVEAIIAAPCNTPVEGVHWLCGEGCKPQWSQFDAAFLGLPADPTAPEEGGPIFDEGVHVLESAARGFVSADERQRKIARRPQ